VIRLRKGHLRLDDRFCWTDAHAFEYLIEKADAQEDMPSLQKAVRLYGGPFLGDDDSEPWAISYRERLRSKFLRAIGKLGRLYEQKGEREKAVELYQIGLEVDGLAEQFYQRLMLCHYASGRKAEALAVYARCSETLTKILGIEPSPQTRTIYEALRREE
jgi:DNA-binding SARP family transcriptional activator